MGTQRHPAPTTDDAPALRTMPAQERWTDTERQAVFEAGALASNVDDFLARVAPARDGAVRAPGAYWALLSRRTDFHPVLRRAMREVRAATPPPRTRAPRHAAFYKTHGLDPRALGAALGAALAGADARHLSHQLGHSDEYLARLVKQLAAGRAVDPRALAPVAKRLGVAFPAPPKRSEAPAAAPKAASPKTATAKATPKLATPKDAPAPEEEPPLPPPAPAPAPTPPAEPAPRPYLDLLFAARDGGLLTQARLEHELARLLGGAPPRRTP